VPGPDLDLLRREPHRRWDPLRGTWVLVSPDRASRPWQGKVEPPPTERRPPYDAGCYLCPGNVRANGERNPQYEQTFAFTNDFAALMPDARSAGIQTGSYLLLARSEPGTSRVVCFSPRHDLDLGAMAAEDCRGVVDLWAAETAELGKRWRSVQVFENRGEAMGASNPHPHGQIWAGTSLPDIPAREDATQREHFGHMHRSLLGEVADLEADGPRHVLATEHWLAIVPFWAIWPFETLLIPRASVARLPDLNDGQRDDLANMLGRLVRAYDALFGVPFPYSMGWHGAPFEPEASAGDATEAWRLHAHFYPPLLRSASVRKFMVGYELLAEPQRDLLPEDAAERLRSALDASL